MIKEKINIFVDLNKCLSASNVLPISIDATLTELEKAKKNLLELEELILRRSCERIHPKKSSSGGRKENFLSAHARFH